MCVTTASDFISSECDGYSFVLKQEMATHNTIHHRWGQASKTVKATLWQFGIMQYGLCAGAENNNTPLSIAGLIDVWVGNMLISWKKVLQSLLVAAISVTHCGDPWLWPQQTGLLQHTHMHSRLACPCINIAYWSRLEMKPALKPNERVMLQRPYGMRSREIISLHM